MKNMSVKLGSRIKSLRKDRGLSQARLAEQILIDAKYLSQLELGIRNPSLATLFKISRGLEVQVKELFEFDPAENVRTELCLLVDSLSEAETLKVYKIIRILAE